MILNSKTFRQKRYTGKETANIIQTACAHTKISNVLYAAPLLAYVVYLSLICTTRMIKN